MAEFDINAKVTYDTTQAQASLKATASAANQTAAATTSMTTATQKSQMQIGQFGSAIGLAGQAAGRLSPALGGVVSTAGAATGAIQSLTTLGLGPAGIALGVISVAVTAGSALWGIYADEQKKAAESMKLNIIPTLDDLISKSQQAQRALALTSRTQMAVGSATEQAQFVEQGRLYVEQVKQKIANLERTGPTGTGAFGLVTDLDRLTQRQEMARLRGELTRAESVVNYRRELQAQAAEEQRQIDQEMIENFQEEIRAREEAAREAAARAGGGGGGRGRAATVAEREDPNAAARAAGEELDRLWEQSERRLAERRARWEDEAAFQAELNKIEADDVRLRLESLEREEADAERLREKNAEEHAQRMQAINDTVFQALESALASSVDAWLSGSRSIGEAAQDMVKSIAKSLASEAIVQGLKATAMGLGALAVGSPTAALHFAEAGKWAAVGAAAGLIGAASGAFGGGGGGGGGAPAAATGGPALTAGAREGAGTTVVINWGSSGLVYAADRAQLGRDISGMISEAHGRLGRGM